MISTLSRETQQNQVFCSNNYQKRVPPFVKSHSDWGLVVVQDEMVLQENQRNDKLNPSNRAITHVSKEPVYSVPDLTISNPNLIHNKSLINRQLHYYSTTTPITASPPHESFRVCLLIFIEV